MNILEVMRTGPLIPVLTIDDASRAVPLARALVAGGIRVLEITLRTPAALAATRAIAAEVQGAITGVGTLTSKSQFREAKAAGALFAVSPGFTPQLAEGARESGLPLLPGVMTPSDIIAATAAGYKQLKFFPAQPAGGTAMLKAFAGPFPDVTFCPTGGITPQTAKEFLALPNVACIGGSWVAPADAVAGGDWDKITQLAAAAVRSLKSTDL
jgi:2-dehydro-3-deoxyphosphogluconate aldolase/(4S)-4-hydroxy-2-oxoglutarate aldolase